MIAAAHAGIATRVLLNKVDLPAAAAARERLEPYRRMGVPVLEASVKQDPAGTRALLAPLLAHALDLLLSARKIGAAEAERLGLVNKVFAQAGFMDEVMAYARTLADTVSPRSMAVIKAQLWKAPFQDFAAALAVADSEMQKSFGSEDFREGVSAFLAKRPPRFAGR